MFTGESKSGVQPILGSDNPFLLFYNEGINFPVQLTMMGTLIMQMRMKSLSRQVKMFLLLWGMLERKARRAPPRMKTSKEEMVARAQEKTIPAVIKAGKNWENQKCEL